MSGPPRQPVEQRFWSKVDLTGECWLWLGTTRSGYGQFRLPGRKGRVVLAHRWSYEYLVGPIPEGLTIDHLCRVPACVNPDHMEPVTHRVNTLRGEGPPAINARKTECIHGHPFDAENTYTYPNGKYRRCRVCDRACDRAYRRRKQASLVS